ncbi:glycoside hydrolase family 18 protein [Burkholderiaceae bacterium DAT-1]|nr:glycoside hydrolase family 18 protein [Burkholderiaceae bacterium DAT-1]
MGSYFPQWGIYSQAYYIKNMATPALAGKLTYLNYAFNNIYKQADGTYKCQGQITRTEPATNGTFDVNNPANGTGGDAFADIQKSFDASLSVDGVADTWNSPVKGSFGQLIKLKKKFPNLKVVMSLGGWSWSKYFSAAAATDAGRKALVSSCVDIYINGNYPVDTGSNTGGKGVLKGLFDGIDIDWEYPGMQAIGYNTFDAVNDKHNFTLLMQEFRTQLDAAGKAQGKRFVLTAAVGAGSDKIAQTEPSQYAQYMDWINLMTYDFHGAWDATGPTNFQSNLYVDPLAPDYLDPKTGKPGLLATYNINGGVTAITTAGFPANKISLGVPFYGRGWTGVTNANNGLYQKAKGGASGSVESGINNYKVLKTFNGGKTFFNSTAQQSWAFDGTTFWSYDTPADIQNKINYLKSKGMIGIFSWSIDGDDTAGTLTDAMSKVNP